MNYISHNDAIKLITQLIIDERIIPFFGAGFTKGSSAYRGTVPDGDKCTEMMQSLIKKYIPEIDDNTLSTYDFNETSKRFRKASGKSIPTEEYSGFFKNNFTQVTLTETKTNFLKLHWPCAFTINIDDGIENTKLFNPILPYKDARQHITKIDPSLRPLYKLHGDASYEVNYNEDNIIFDVDQYTQSLHDENNQTMRENFSAAYKEFNILFIGCSLKNEPDIKFIYNSIVKNRMNTKIMILRTNTLSSFEEEDLEDYGITDVILTKDYDVFYLDLINSMSEKQIQDKLNCYPFINPSIKRVEDENYKYFSGYKSFDENKNEFSKSKLMIDRDCIYEIENALKTFDIVFIEGRRFSGKTTLLSSICEREKSRTVYYFPSTTLESVDVINNIVKNAQNSLLIFDSNSLSYDSYYSLLDISFTLKENQNKIIIALNQSDTYISENIPSEYITLKATFGKDELSKLKESTDGCGFTQRKEKDTNLDYLNIIKKEQGVDINFSLNLPHQYTKNEQILLLLLCVKDRVYSRDIISLGIKDIERKEFLERISILGEWIKTAKGETNTFSTYKLVHNSKKIILEEFQKFSHEDIVEAIEKIVSTFKNGDNDQKRIYREVMQFDTLNQLFGRKKGAGRLIFTVYKNLEPTLKEDLHFWLQRAKSIYRLAYSDYTQLKKAYTYAKKVYIDSTNKTLVSKAALTSSLICCLLSSLEHNAVDKHSLLEEAIILGHEAIFSEYYKQEKRLNIDLSIENTRKNYSELIKDICNAVKYSENYNANIIDKADAIIGRLD